MEVKKKRGIIIKTELLEIFNDLNINYQMIEHEPVYTVKEAQKINMKIEGFGCKNLFLKSNKKYYLLISLDDEILNLNEISKKLNLKKFSFASVNELDEKLKLIPGSCTPFGIINDKDNEVTLLLSTKLQNKKLLFHPLTNQATINITYNDLIKFINTTKHLYKTF